MALFNERMVEYITDMGIEKQALAVLLGKKPNTVSGYFKKGFPRGKALIEVADAMYVSLDWLLGREVMVRWSPDIAQLRLHLFVKAPQLQAVDDANAHARQVIAWMQEYDARFRREWFIAGILGFTVEQYQEFMRSALALTEHQGARLCRFTGLPEGWLYSGNLRLLERLDTSEYANGLSRYLAENVTPAEFESQIPRSITNIKIDRQLRQAEK